MIDIFSVKNVNIYQANKKVCIDKVVTLRIQNVFDEVFAEQSNISQ